MSKFVFYTDPHFAGENPQRRVDDYPRAVLNKLREIYQVAVDEKADFLLSAGDIFNGHRMFNLELLGELMDLIRDSGLKTYTAVGQHDIFGYNASSYYKSSTLAFIERRKVGLEVIWNPMRVGDVQLVPSHVWEDPKDAAHHELDDDAFKILVAHHLLTNKKTMFDTVNTGDFAKWMREEDANYDMVLSGDLHDGYAVHEVDGMWFCNPGSLARRAISDGKRPPKYVVIDVEPGEIPVIDVRHVKCAGSGDDVFGETSAAEIMRERTEFDPTAFIKEIEEFEVESADVHEMVRKVGKAKGIRNEVLDYIDSKCRKTS